MQYHAIIQCHAVNPTVNQRQDVVQHRVKQDGHFLRKHVAWAKYGEIGKSLEIFCQFMEAWEKKSMVFDMKTWRKIPQNSINLLGSKHLRSPGMVAERVWLGTVRLCIHAYKYCKDIIYILYTYIHTYIHTYIVWLSIWDSAPISCSRSRDLHWSVANHFWEILPGSPF